MAAAGAGGIRAALWLRDAWPAGWQLGLFVVVPALLLSFGSQHRWFYMLPGLAPMALLMASAAVYYNRHGEGLWLPRVLASRLHLLHWLLFAAAMVALLVAPTAPGNWLPGAVGLGVCLLAAAAYRVVVPVDGWRFSRSLRATALLLVVLVISLNLSGLVWSESTWNRDRFARQVADMVPAPAPLAILDGEPVLHAYHARRRVPQLVDWDQVSARVNAAAGTGLYLVVRREQLPAMPGRLQCAAMLDSGEFDLLRCRAADAAPRAPTAEPAAQ